MKVDASWYMGVGRKIQYQKLCSTATFQPHLLGYCLWVTSSDYPIPGGNTSLENHLSIFYTILYPICRT